MTVAVQQIVDSFETLPEAEKHQAALEILRRTTWSSDGDLPESALIHAADELFQALDAEEALHAPS